MNEGCSKRLEVIEERITDVENTMDALSLLPGRLADLREAVADIRTALKDVRAHVGVVEKASLALVVERADGSVEAKSAGINWRTWSLYVSSTVVPIVVAIIMTS